MKQEFKRNGKLESIFDLVANNFESVGPSYFTYFGHQLINRSEIVSGQKVLDVACGRGASLLRASEIVGPSGEVIGTDFSGEMIKNLASHISKKNVENVQVIQMDAEDIRLPDNHFDYVFSGLSTHFFSNPILAVHEMHRVLKSEGKLGISSWSIKRDTKEMGVYEKASLKVFPESYSKRVPQQKTRPDFSSIKGFTSILSEAGFSNIVIQEESKVFYYKDKDEWWNEQNNNATRGFFERIKEDNPSLFDKFKTAVFEEMELQMEDDRIKFEANVLYGYGIKR
jgi:ubiquinone/menaquinone biosynthesis C-methylase UbiE